MAWKACCIALAASAALSCGPRGGTDVGNGATVTFDAGAYKKTGSKPSSARNKPLVLESGAEIDAFWVTLRDFRLLGDECTDALREGKLLFEGPLVADLTRDDAFPGASPEASIVAGGYCRVKATLAPSDDALPPGAPPELEGASVYVRGVRADGTPFTVRSEKSMQLQLDSPGSFPVEGHTPLVVAFDVTAAITSLELDELTEPTIAIDDSLHSDRAAHLRGSLRDTAALFRDENEDGLLSGDEGTADKVLASTN